jgi:hypothetical protein
MQMIYTAARPTEPRIFYPTINGIARWSARKAVRQPLAQQSAEERQARLIETIAERFGNTGGDNFSFKDETSPRFV